MFSIATDMIALSSAFQRVKENSGCAGVDGVTVDMFERDLKQNLSQLREELVYLRYKPLPLLKILVDKGNGEARALSIPSVSDRVAQNKGEDDLQKMLQDTDRKAWGIYKRGKRVSSTFDGSVICFISSLMTFLILRDAQRFLRY